MSLGGNYWLPGWRTPHLAKAEKYLDKYLQKQEVFVRKQFHRIDQIFTSVFQRTSFVAKIADLIKIRYIVLYSHNMNEVLMTMMIRPE